MKTILAMILSLTLCTQPVYAQAGLNTSTGQAAKEKKAGEEKKVPKKEEAPEDKNETKPGATEEQTEPEMTEEETAPGATEEETAPEGTNEQPEAGTEEGQTPGADQTAGVEISAPSAILIEAATGKVIYDKNAHEQLAPASVTKIMTLLLIFDALEAEKIRLEDEVTTSEYAASMGGSQVFLEPGEVQTVDTMIKCIAVASANDACVAMAEYISGSEEEFVRQMNERAKSLGMENTTFMNSNGLDVDGHMTTAYDIALMSKELITKYPEIHNYSKIWMEDITHVTKKGTEKFGLTNTNKLIRQYQYATGLKTGSTSKAKYCVSATAKKNDIELIAVIMAAPDYKVRFADATNLLTYGFGKCTRYEDAKPLSLQPAEVSRGKESKVEVKIPGKFQYIDTEGADLSTIKRKVVWGEKLTAPIKKGDKVGEVQYVLNGKTIGTMPITASEHVDKMTFKSAFLEALAAFLL